MNNLIPAAKMASKAPVAQQMARPMSNAAAGINHFAGSSSMAGKAAAPVMNPNHQLAAELKSGAVKFTPDKPAPPSTATKVWSA